MSVTIPIIARLDLCYGYIGATENIEFSTFFARGAKLDLVIVENEASDLNALSSGSILRRIRVLESCVRRESCDTFPSLLLSFAA